MAISPIKTKVDTTIEKRIIVGMITSKDYLYQIHHMLNLNYFQSSFIRRVAKWCIEFFDTYEEAPFTHIQDVYNKERLTLPPDEVQLIGSLLSTLSDNFEQEKDNNIDYLVKDTTFLFTKRQLEITTENIQGLLARGTEEDVKNAQEELLNYTEIAKSTSEWANPFDPKEVSQVFRNRENEFFKFPGQLGTFLRNFKRSWLVGISAPFKKGKTWFLEEFGIIGMLSHLRVAFISLEMSKEEMEERVYKRLISASDEGGVFIFPVFDCKKNQYGLCMRPERKNRVALGRMIQPADDDEEPYESELPEYDSSNRYRPCTYCRDNQIWKDYRMATWYTEHERPPFNEAATSKPMEAFNRLYGNYLRVIAYPKFSANSRDIERDLNVLERTEGYIPDMILIDMVDNMQAEKEHMQGVSKEDEAWMCLARLAGKRKALTVTPTQVTKEALDAAQLTQKHTARWVGKLGHVDAMISLNQTEEEKIRGVMRIGVMVHRHEDFEEHNSVTILQQLTLGQVNLDSQM